MITAQNISFSCPDHPNEVISRIEALNNSERDLYCTECLLHQETPQILTSQLKKIDVFLNEVASQIKLNKPKNTELLQKPVELSELLHKQAESSSNVASTIEKEKEKTEKIFDWISSTVQEIIACKRKQYIELLDNQKANFIFQYDSLHKQVRKVYPSFDDIELLYPTLDQLTTQLHDLKDASAMAKFMSGLKQDFHELKSGNRGELIQTSIQDLTSKIKGVIETPPSIGDFDYKAQIGKFEKFIDAYLNDSLQLNNAINGPQSVSIGKGGLRFSGSFGEIDPRQLSVTVSSTIGNGGGTGLEYPENLLKSGDGPGNKWCTTNSGEQWIKVDLKGPRLLKMYGLKSANDFDGRDPYSWQALGKTKSGAWEVFHEVKGVKFDRRYEFRFFAVNPEKEYTEVQFKIDKSRSLADNGSWGDGSQLAEVSFFEAKNYN